MPFHFNIPANYLHKMVQLPQENGLFVSFVPHLMDHGIAILQHADDTILFIQDELEGARNLKLLLYMFERN